MVDPAGGLVPNVDGIAKHSGETWQALPDNTIRANVGIGAQAITFAGDNLYVGGLFTESAGGAVQNLGNIAVLALSPLANYLLYLPLVQR